MKVDRYTTLHRKDERGVIVESGVFGPDDEIPEGFGTGEYQPVYAPREDDQAPADESVLTPWESPIAKGTWVEQSEPEEVEDELSETDEDEDDVVVPPQGGPGSGKDAWAAYAASQGVEVEDGATRDEIIAACEAADVPVA